MAGSEEETDGDDEEEVLQEFFMPRVARIYLPDYDNDEEEATLTVRSWPPDTGVAVVELPDPQLVESKEVILEAVMQQESASSSSEQQAVPSLLNQLPTSTPLSGSVFPTDKFDFYWSPFPEVSSPQLRRESFSQNNGPTANYADPYDAFIAIWDRPIMEYIARETNRYAQQLAEAMMSTGISPNSRIAKWVETTADEIYTYFSIILAMGIVGKSRLEEYWQVSRDIFSTPEFSAAMSFDRFHLLGRCLHFNDNASCKERNMAPKQAKLQKILPIVQHLNKKFQNLYNLGRNIAFDESLSQWSGRLSIRQYIPNKSARVGIKTYEVCDSQTGYLWRFRVETCQHSANIDEDPISGKIPSLVLKLLHGLEQKGYTVWMDNYYNSPALARELKVRGFDCVGTLRTNRQFVPEELHNLKANDMAPGDLCGCTSGDVDLILWRDKKRISFISTYHGLETITCGDVLKPAVVQDYNNCMGGVDRKDQMLAMYPIERKRTSVWYKKFFRRLLNASVLNAYIMFKANQQISHRNFRKSLVLRLLERHNIRDSSKACQLIKSAPSWLHIPQFFEREKGVNSHARRLRRKCVVCPKRTTSYCDGCGVEDKQLPEWVSIYYVKIRVNEYKCNICELTVITSGQNIELLNHIKAEHKDIFELHKENPQANVGFRIEFLHLNVLKDEGGIKNQPLILGEVCEAAAEEIIQPIQEKEVETAEINQQIVIMPKTRKVKSMSVKIDNRKRSWVWKYFHQMSNIIFRCTLCNVVLSIKGCNTNNMNRHVRTRHPAIYRSEAVKKRSSSVDNLEDYMDAEIPVAIKTEEISASDKDFDDIESTSSQRQRRSWIWLYFTRISPTSAKCKLCNRNIVHGGNATGNMNRHLKMIHRKTGEDHHWVWKVFDCQDDDFYSCKICQYQCMKFADIDKSVNCILEHLRDEHGVISGDQIITGNDDGFDEETN